MYKVQYMDNHIRNTSMVFSSKVIVDQSVLLFSRYPTEVSLEAVHDTSASLSYILQRAFNAGNTIDYVVTLAAHISFRTVLSARASTFYTPRFIYFRAVATFNTVIAFLRRIFWLR